MFLSGTLKKQRFDSIFLSLFTFLNQEHDKQLFLIEQLQRQKLELEQQKREFEEQEQRRKQAELQVGCVTPTIKCKVLICHVRL